jgi:hypothetical protein
MHFKKIILKERFSLTTLEDIVGCCLKAGISEAEQTSIASQPLDNVHPRGNAE